MPGACSQSKYAIVVQPAAVEQEGGRLVRGRVLDVAVERQPQ